MQWEKKLLKNINFTIPLLVLALIICGFVAISTAAEGASGGSTDYLRTQFVAAVLGILLVIFVQFFDYRLLREYDIILYAAVIFLLGILLILGSAAGGGRRWLSLGPVTFQPSEVAKILMILFFAGWLDRKDEEEIQSYRGFLKNAGLVLLPFIFIVLQNDLGTALVLLFIFIVMHFAAGGRLMHILATFGGATAAFIAMIASHLFLSTPLFFLQPYQVNRLISFINPGIDPHGIGYNIIQAQIAIGSGQLTGRGYMAGPQNQLNFLPEQHTDFIFAVIGEEFGFLGSALIIILFTLLMLQMIRVTINAKDNFGRLISLGITAMFFFHVVENIGMSLGVMPITGIPLPFISYGGSSLVTSMIAVGLILNINMRRKKINF